MVRKICNTGFLAMAYLALLVHVVIPHHHHGHEVFLSDHHAVSPADDLYHCDHEDHEIPDDCRGDCITLRQIVISSPFDSDFSIDAGPLLDDDSQPVFYAALLPPLPDVPGSIPHYKVRFWSTQRHLLPNRTHSTKGLRAPPLFS